MELYLSTRFLWKIMTPITVCIVSDVRVHRDGLEPAHCFWDRDVSRLCAARHRPSLIVDEATINLFTPRRPQGEIGGAGTVISPCLVFGR
jgi:hypothetical protein